MNKILEGYLIFQIIVLVFGFFIGSIMVADYGFKKGIKHAFEGVYDCDITLLDIICSILFIGGLLGIVIGAFIFNIFDKLAIKLNSIIIIKKNK